MVGGKVGTEDLDVCFRNLGVAVGGGEMGGGAIVDWKDLPMELLMRIISLVDDRTVIMAFGVCTGWREAISLGLTHLSLSWYFLIYCLYANKKSTKDAFAYL